MATKERLLSVLESSRGAYLSGEELARRLDVSRAAVWKAVKALREEGYGIDAVTNKGYCLSAATDILSPQGIRKYLGPEGETLDLRVVPEVDSTNSALRELAGRGAPEGVVVIANRQNAGRGRRGRPFFSPEGTGLYLSILLRPKNWSALQATRVTTMAAAAMCEAIGDVTGEEARIKWVNDICMRGRKVCGILTEASMDLESGSLDFAVLGAGVNVYAPPEGFPPELREVAGAVLEHPADDAKCRLAAAFLTRFLEYYRGADPTAYARRYREYSLALHREITVGDGPEARRAYVYEIDEDCRLLVRYENGETAALSYGEIRIHL